MATAQIKTVGRLGIQCFSITVEVDVSPGLPAFTIVGLADTIVQESRERIRTAIRNSHATFPLLRITVNLAPADIKKEGVGFDLPIAVGILAASQQIPLPNANDLFYGELGLSGELKPTRGVLPFILTTKTSDKAYIPEANIPEAQLAMSPATIYGTSDLTRLITHLKGEAPLTAAPYQEWKEPIPPITSDFADVHGQAAAKRALEVATAGHHNILLTGSPGSGKTLLSRSLPGIMPPLTRSELLETTQIYSVAGLLSSDVPFMQQRPFRSPHHSASLVSLVGGSNPPRPGEITLAHNGVLFLDEFAELPRGAIEALRQPLEDRVITVARAGVSVEFPAHCLLVAAVNPCPCGYRNDTKRECTCSPQQVNAYQRKLSGPILDRIDLHVAVPPVSVGEITQSQPEEPSASIRQRVAQARQRQAERYSAHGILTNSQLSNKLVHLFCPLSPEAQALLDKAIDTFRLSARGYYRILKVGRTIADLNNETELSQATIAEALHYRPTEF